MGSQEAVSRSKSLNPKGIILDDGIVQLLANDVVTDSANFNRGGPSHHPTGPSNMGGPLLEDPPKSDTTIRVYTAHFVNTDGLFSPPTGSAHSLSFTMGIDLGT